MLLYSIADLKSFHALKKLYKEIMLVEQAVALPFCIIGTQSDLEEERRYLPLARFLSSRLPFLVSSFPSLLWSGV